jgi:hypothetical protein
MSGFGTQLLDVAIGLFFTYVVISLIATAVLEILETVLRTRSKYLWQGIGELLDDPATRGSGGTARGSSVPCSERRTDGGGDPPVTFPPISVASLYEHPMVSGLFYGPYPQAVRRLAQRQLPAYIPRERFSIAVIDLVSRGYELRDPASFSSIERLRRGIAAMPPSAARTALESITRVAGDDVTLVQRQIEAWYDTVMDNIAGWYKRHAQRMLLLIGLTLAAAGNVDSFAIAKDLATNEPKRQALFSAASAFAASHEKEGPTPGAMKSYLDAIPEGPFVGLKEVNFKNVVYRFPGWLVTAFAVSLGAPFWFDLLNKFMVVRSTVKPREKSQDEGSEDRPATGRADGASSSPTVFVRGA